LPWRGKPLRAGSKRTSRNCLMSKKPFCLRHRMTFSKWMKSGVLYAKKITNDACGRRCAGERAKSWGSPLASESLATCRRLWESLPDDYKHCHPFSDFWHAYQHVFPAETHHCVGKETGETAHMERWNNTLRQRVGRSVRQTWSFSKSHGIRNE
jgi:IS1 family transposase